MKNQVIKALFLDVGGVLMTNGWDHALRKRTCDHFNLDYDEVTRRHQLVFDTYETGKLTFDEYLSQIIFYEKRSFSTDELKTFIFNAVRPYQETIDYLKEIKAKYNLKIGVVSNEGRELAVDRIQRFDLPSFVDFFIISSFVHFRKPDPDIYHLAIDVMQVPPTEILYLDDRAQLVEVALGLGLQAMQHTDLEATKARLSVLLEHGAPAPSSLAQG